MSKQGAQKGTQRSMEGSSEGRQGSTENTKESTRCCHGGEHMEASTKGAWLEAQWGAWISLEQ